MLLAVGMRRMLSLRCSRRYGRTFDAIVGWFFFFKQKTAYEMRISDWSSDVCSSDLGPVDAVVDAVFSQQVRFIGAGTIGVAALWTLLKIVGPIARGIQGSIASSRARGHGEVVELGERDLSFNIVVGTILGSLVPIAGLLWFFAQGGPIAANPVAVISATLLFLLFIGAIIAAVTGYMAGLIGASNSPVSGVGILAIIAASLMLLLLFGRDNRSEERRGGKGCVSTC